MSAADSFDAIVIGAGHNGLTAAAFLGRAGRKVVVLERRDVIGGVAAAEEFHPGYRTHGLLHDSGGVRASVIAALELERHGLRRRPAPPVLAPEPGEPGLLLWADAERTRAELARRAPKDADRFIELRAFLGQTAPFLARVLDAPPPDLGQDGLAGAWPLLAKAWALRRLGSDTMHEVLRIAPMCAADWLNEQFKDDLLKAALAAPAVAATWAGPWSAGTAALLWLHEATRGDEIDGGPPALVRALAAACAAHGVEIRTGATVRAIALAGGKVSGVELEHGGLVRAPLVLSSIEPSRALLGLLAPADQPVGLAGALRSWRCRGTTAAVHLALDGPLQLEGRADETIEAVRIGEDLDTLERAFDAVKYRQMSETPNLDVRVPSVADPSLAPSGHHVVSILVHFAPFALDGGWNDEARRTLLARTLARLEQYAPGVKNRIVGQEVLAPPDLEARYGLTGGHPHHGEHALDQMFWLRPAAPCARYRTPIDGLVLCGSGSHPGGGITCAPGALAARAVLRGR